jgi:hypothetical protein
MMRINFVCWFAFLFAAGVVVACSGSDEETDLDNDFSESLDSLEEELTERLWNTDGDEEYFELELPYRMFPREDLNSDASLQYGYVQDIGGEVLEHYVIVMVEPMDSVAKHEQELDLHLDFDIESYNDLCLENMGGNMDTFEITTNDPVTNIVNGMECKINDMRGSKGDVSIYYRLGVYVGKRGYYQVLTWCIESQTEEFEDDMEKILASMKELEEASAELQAHEIH